MPLATLLFTVSYIAWLFRFIVFIIASVWFFLTSVFVVADLCGVLRHVNIAGSEF